MSWEEHEGRLWEAGVCCPVQDRKEEARKAPGLDPIFCVEWTLWSVGAGPRLLCRVDALECGCRKQGRERPQHVRTVGQIPARGVWCLVLAESLGEFRITQVRASVSRKIKVLLGVLPGSPISWL